MQRHIHVQMWRRRFSNLSPCELHSFFRRWIIMPVIKCQTKVMLQNQHTLNWEKRATRFHAATCRTHHVSTPATNHRVATPTTSLPPSRPNFWNNRWKRQTAKKHTRSPAYVNSLFDCRDGGIVTVREDAAVTAATTSAPSCKKRLHNAVVGLNMEHM